MSNSDEYHILRIWVVFVLFWPSAMLGQYNQLGYPKITNYTKNVYHAALPNRHITSDAKGNLLIGNDYGLMTFDGHNWNLLLQPDNRTIIRSLEITNGDTLFIGAQGDFGYMLKDQLGRQSFHSLVPLLKKEVNSFEDVWSIFEKDGFVYFQTQTAIYVFKGNQIVTHTPKHEFTYAAKHSNKILIMDQGYGLCELVNGEIRLIPHGEKMKDLMLKFILDFKSDGLLLGTMNEGFYLFKDGQLSPWQTDISSFMKTTLSNVCLSLFDGSYVLGTAGKGLAFFDRKGRIIKKIDKRQGLVNNTVNHLYEDDNHQLWAALNNGISHIERSSNFSYIDERSGLIGAAHAFLVSNQKLYIGTSEGLFYSDFLPNTKALNFKMIPGSSGQIWSLNLLDGMIWIGHHLGAFILDHETLVPVNTTELGAWMFEHPPGRKDLIIQGSYQGIFLLEKVNNKWQTKTKIHGYTQTAREFQFDSDGSLWLTHGYKGIYRMKMSNAFDSIVSQKLYTQKEGLPSDLFNNIFKIDDAIIFGTQRGVYLYDHISDSMIANDYYKSTLGTSHLVRRMKTTPDNNLFFVSGYDNTDHIGFIHNQLSGKEKRIEVPFQQLRGELVPGFEAIEWIDDQTLVIGTKDGCVLYRKNYSRNYHQPFCTQVSKVYCTNKNDSIIYGANHIAIDTIQIDHQILPYEMNALRFTYSATFFERPANTLFQSKLAGADGDWSQWTKTTSRGYTNLKPGKYTFRVRSKNIYDVNGQEAKFVFEVLPPWYESSAMKILYFSSLMVLIGFVLRYRNKQALHSRQVQKKNSQEQLRRQQEAYQKEKLVIENQIFKLKTEKLQSDIDFKSRDLASSTIHMVQLNETIINLKDQIKKISVLAGDSVKEHLEKVIFTMNDMLNSEQHWESFEMHFNQVHNDFIHRLKEEYPDLSARELRLCAYLRMNLSTKEIAPLMGISLRGIEGLRYRVRKKISVDGNDNLTDFIVKY